MNMRGHHLTVRFCATLFVVISIGLFLTVIGNVHAHKSLQGSKQTTGLIKISAVSALNPNKVGSQIITNLIDGNLNTIWKTKQLPQNIILDLGLSQMISSTRIALGAHRKKRVHRYSISISLDSINWVKVANNRSFSTSQWTKASFTPVNARYVKVSLNSVSHKDVVAIRDIEIYGRIGNSNNKGNQKITLNWRPNSGRIDGYLVFYGPNASMASAQISDISVNSSGFSPLTPSIQYDTWLDLNALPGDNVCFRLRAYSAVGISGWSSAVCSGV